MGRIHLAALAAVPVTAVALAALARGHPRVAHGIRLALAAAIAMDGVGWYGYALASGAARPPHGLPLELCDVVLGVTAYALASGRAWALETSWFLGLAGSGMALLTPDVGPGSPPWATAQFFVAHGLVVVSVLFLVLAGLLRPRPGAWWRVFAGLNAYAALVAVFDARFGTNYLYLRAKPQTGTLLDLLGPWPVYVLAAEPVALLLLLALDLPFRRRGGGGGRRASAAARSARAAHRAGAPRPPPATARDRAARACRAGRTRG